MDFITRKDPVNGSGESEEEQHKKAAENGINIIPFQKNDAKNWIFEH